MTMINSIKKYSILTTLWHFYLYLNDMDFLKVRIIRKENQNYEYYFKLPIHLKQNPQTVLNSGFFDTQLLKSMEDVCDLWDEAGRTIGKVKIRIAIDFEKQIHRQLVKEKVIDFSEMLVIDGISRIGSMGSSENLIDGMSLKGKDS